MGTAEWRDARRVRSRRAENDREDNIFNGGTRLESTRIDGVPVLRLSAWPANVANPPHSFALALADSTGSGSAPDPAENDWPDEDFGDDDEQEERRNLRPDFKRDFAEYSEGSTDWEPAGATTPLPLKLEWRQTAESRWQFDFQLEPDARCFALGERQSGLNLRSAVHTLFNTDDDKHIESIDSMYISIPFLIVWHRGQCSALFLDSPARQKWDLDAELTGNGRIELLSRRGWQLYMLGPGRLPDMVSAFTKVTGRSPLPPLWALGHQQSRWSYPDQDTVIRIASEFRSRQIPCDTIVLDIDYMEDYRVFTYSKERFPEFKQLISDLGNNDFKVVVIVDPGVKKDVKYQVFKDGKKHGLFCTTSDGKPFVGEVWPGASVLPDFVKPETRTWWAAQHGFYTDLGVAGIWTDMNEPSLFQNQRPLDKDAKELPPDNRQLFMQQAPEGPVGHFEVRNVYGLQMSRATYDGLLALRPRERPFVLTRSAYAGIQRYAAVWLGDNRSWWEQLARSIPMLLNMGLSGVPFCGVDIGGFYEDCSAELLVRWYALGIFYPFFRNHCSRLSCSQEPWAFSPVAEGHCKALIEWRYRLLPYIQQLFFEHARTGAPLMRPMAWHYPDDEFAVEIDDQFLFGEDILVAPIVQRGRTTRSVYLPEGRWHSLDGKQSFEGGRLHKMRFGLGQVPALVRDGAILPLADVMQTTRELAKSPITFHCYGDSGRGYFYEDDGISFEYLDGDFNQWRVSVENGTFRAQPMSLGFERPERKYQLLYKGKSQPVQLII